MRGWCPLANTRAWSRTRQARRRRARPFHDLDLVREDDEAGPGRGLVGGRSRPACSAALLSCEPCSVPHGGSASRRSNAPGTGADASPFRTCAVRPAAARFPTRRRQQPRRGRPRAASDAGPAEQPLDQQRPRPAHEVEHAVGGHDAAEADHRGGDRRVRGAGVVGHAPGAGGQGSRTDADEHVPAVVARRPGAPRGAPGAQLAVASRRTAARCLGQQGREPLEHRRVGAGGFEAERRRACRRRATSPSRR